MTVNVNVPEEQLQESDCEPMQQSNGTQVTSEDEATTTSPSDNHNNGETPKDDATNKEIVEKSPAAASGDKSSIDQELIVIQENLYPIKILVPGMEPFEVQVSPQELVQELHQLLKDREGTCHRTCFKLQFNGNTMDNFCELKNIEGMKEGSEVKLVEEMYSVREARLHVRHVRDLLHSLDNVDAHHGSDCSSLCYVNLVTDNDISTDGNLANNAAAPTVSINNSSSSNKQQTTDNSGRTSPAESPTPATTDNNDTSNNKKTTEHKRRRRAGDQQATNENIVDCTPPDYIMPGAKDRIITPIHPTSNELMRMDSCIKVVCMSQWNPPPGGRLLHGDLIYLYVVTNEQKRFHITCNPRGFYVNQTDIDTFNPKPVPGAQVFHSLIDLLNHLSPSFKRNFAILNRKRFNRHPFERIATPFQVNCWTAPDTPHEVDHVRAEDTFSSRLIVEEHLPGQNTRDWNEEISGTRELPRTTLPERLIRERAMFKVHSDFVAAATRGAVLCVDGNVMAINPGDAKNMRMYIWNNIFFSLGFDVRDHYKDYGGHHAAFYAPSADLNGVKAYGALDVEGLNVLGTAVVDYKGYRVTAQTIIPGILEREQEQSVVYGSIDFGKTIRTTDEFLNLLSKTTKPMHIIPHSIKDAKSESISLQSSIECKGIHGNDKRHYILDLQKSFPPDVNFLPPPGEDIVNSSTSSEVSKFGEKSPAAEIIESEEDKERKKKFSRWQPMLAPECTQMGFPRKHRHRLLTHRPELVEAFVEHAYHVFVCHCTTKIVSYRNTEKQKQQQIGSSESGDTPAVTTEEEKMKSASESSALVAKWQEDAVRSAAKAVGSYRDDEFDIRFNPDIFSPGLNFDQSDEQVEQERRMICDLARFLIKNQIPTFIKDCLDHVSAPLDGAALTKALHDKGIGMRYLGKVVPLMKESRPLQHIYKIGILEIILRSAKHVMRPYMQHLDQMSVAHGTAHFFNCLLGSLSTPVPNRPDDQLTSKKKKKLRGKNRSAPTSSNNATTTQASAATANNGGANTNGTTPQLPWYRFTPEMMWEKIIAEAKDYYDFVIEDCSGIDDVVEKYGLQKISFLRRICQVMGVQIQTRDYAFDSKNKAVFVEEDIIRLFPIVKHAPPRASDAAQFFSSAQTKVQQGAIREAFELFSESLNLYTNVYGAVHVEIASCYRQLARLHYMMSEHSEAISSQLKAVILTERCLGVDNSSTICDLMNLALYCFASQKISASLKLLYRARYLILLAHGSDHPEIALVDSNIGLVLHGVQEYDLSLKFLDEALKINEKYHGENSHKAALSHHLLARAHSCKGEFRMALTHEKETFKLYKTLYGEKHDKTKESAECLRHLTEQAVTLQRTMNEIYKNGSTVSFPPLQITAPSMQSVLDLMNIMNGIIFIPLSQKELDAIRKEVLKQQELKQITAAVGKMKTTSEQPAISSGDSGVTKTPTPISSEQQQEQEDALD